MQLVVMRFDAEPHQLRAMRRRVIDVLTAEGLAETQAAEVALAVSEACANIIEHAYRGMSGQAIVLTIRREGDRLLFVLEDDAPCIDPARVVPRDFDDLKPGGLGVHFIRQIMDSVTFHPRAGGGNILTMTKDL